MTTHRHTGERNIVDTVKLTYHIRTEKTRLNCHGIVMWNEKEECINGH